MTGLSDSFQRPIDYLRISVTDRCNLRCVYCMPPEGVCLMPHEEILTYEEIHTIVRAAAELGIRKIRLTGGEPLVRPELPKLVRLISSIKTIDDISLTTNGVFLKKYAAELKAAGLRRVNVSLDTLKPERFAQITRGNKLKEVLEGIAEAKKVGLTPVKLNMVVVGGTNDDEIVEFARKTINEDWHIRFIEVMPNTGNGQVSPQFISMAEMKKRIEVIGPLEPARTSVGNGPAKYFRLPNAKGTIGFITPISEHFCTECNRLRLTSDGKLRPCLMAEAEVDLKTPLRNGASFEQLKELFKDTVAHKPEHHHLLEGDFPHDRPFSQVGG